MLAPIKALADLVQTLVSFILGLWDWLIDLVKHLFVPSDNFWDNQLADFKGILEDKFGVEGMQSILTSLQSSKQAEIGDFKMSVMGKTFMIIDMSFVDDNLTLIHSIIYFVFGVLLIKYNLNNVYKTVRGGSLYDN